jgi:mannose-6-phosphate isomerase-like protein (cupin superfamily)
MPGFTITNLKEVKSESAAPDEVEARFARKHFATPELGVSYFRYGPGYRGSTGHRHEVQEEAYVVVGGSGRIRLGDEVFDLRLWDVVRVAPEVVRGFEGGPEGLELIAIGGEKPEGGDGVAVPDWWTD